MEIAQIEPQRPDIPKLPTEILSSPVEISYGALVWRRLRRDRTAMVGAALVLLLTLAAILAPLLSPDAPAGQFRDGLTQDGQPIPSTLLNGSLRFPLGTDSNGRDLLSRILFGARISLVVGVLANTLAVTLGTIIGSVAGYFGGLLESVLMRFTEVMMAFPTLLLAMTLVAILKPSMWIIIVVIGAVYSTWIARVVYGQAASLRELGFVTASRALGAGRFTILF